MSLKYFWAFSPRNQIKNFYGQVKCDKKGPTLAFEEEIDDN